MRDMVNNQQLVFAALQTLAGTTPNNSQAFDTRAFDAATFYMTTNTVTDAGTAAGFTMILQESDSLVGASFTNVSPDDLVGVNPTVLLDTEDNVIAVGGLGYLGIRRYVRAVITGTALTDAVVQVLAVMGKPHRAPVTPVGAAIATT